jgi:hypothetical protein
MLHITSVYDQTLKYTVIQEWCAKKDMQANNVKNIGTNADCYTFFHHSEKKMEPFSFCLSKHRNKIAL